MSIIYCIADIDTRNDQIIFDDIQVFTSLETAMGYGKDLAAEHLMEERPREVMLLQALQKIYPSESDVSAACVLRV